MPTISKSFTKGYTKATEDNRITSKEAQGLRKQACEDVRAPDFNPKDAFEYGKAFDNLTGLAADKASTTNYLKNAAVELKNFEAISKAGPALQAALGDLNETEDFAGALDLQTKMDSGSIFGSPNSKVQLYVELNFSRSTHASHFYAEKVAQFVKSDPRMSEYRDVINTVHSFGYGIAIDPSSVTSGDLQPEPVTGALEVHGVHSEMAKVLEAVQARGKITVPETEKLFDMVYGDAGKCFEKPSDAALFRDGLKKLVPLAGHKVSKSLLDTAIAESGRCEKVLRGREIVAETIEANKGKAPFTGMNLETLRACHGGVAVDVIDIPFDRQQAIGEALTALLSANPEYAALGLSKVAVYSASR